MIVSPTATENAENSAGARVAARNASMPSYQASSQLSTCSSPGASVITGWPPKLCGARA